MGGRQSNSIWAEHLGSMSAVKCMAWGKAVAETHRGLAAP